MERSRPARILRVLGLYIGAGWVYAAAVGVFRPARLSRPLIHQLPHLRIDTFGIVSFALSGALFMASQVLDLARSARQR